MAQKTMFSCTAHFKSSLNIILTKMPQRWKGSNTSKSDRITALQYTIEHVLIFLLKFEVCAIREVRTDHSIRPQSLSSKAKRLFARVDCSMSYSVCASVLLFVGVGASYLWKCIVICESVCINRIIFDLYKCFPSQQVFSIHCDLWKCYVLYLWKCFVPMSHRSTAQDKNKKCCRRRYTHLWMPHICNHEYIVT